MNRLTIPFWVISTLLAWALLRWAVAADEQAVIQTIQDVMIGTGAIIIATVLVFACYWVVAPYRIDVDGRNERVGLEQEIARLKAAAQPAIVLSLLPPYPRFSSDDPPEFSVAVRVENVGAVNLPRCQVQLRYSKIGARPRSFTSFFYSCPPFDLAPTETRDIHVLSFPFDGNEHSAISIRSWQREDDEWVEARVIPILPPPDSFSIVIEALSAGMPKRASLPLLATFVEDSTWEFAPA